MVVIPEYSTSPPAMVVADRASASLGMHIDALAPGGATVSMLVREDMLNGFAITHGGIVFTLADTAFALACNDGGAPVVAAGADIDFLAPTTAGMTLTAVAVSRAEVGRSGVFDVTVTDESGRVVAEFRGRSRRTGTRAAAEGS